MPSCSSTSGTRSVKNSSRGAVHEKVPAPDEHAGVADIDLCCGGLDLAMGVRFAWPISVAGTGSARPLLCVEAFGDIRALPDPELPQVQAGGVQWLVQRRLCQVHGAQR